MEGDDRWQALLAAWMLYGGVLRHKHLTRAEVRKVTMSTVHAHCIKGKQRRLRKGFNFCVPGQLSTGWDWSAAWLHDFALPEKRGDPVVAIRRLTRRWCRRTRSGGLVQRRAKWWGSAPSTWRHWRRSGGCSRPPPARGVFAQDGGSGCGSDPHESWELWFRRRRFRRRPKARDAQVVWAAPPHPKELQKRFALTQKLKRIAKAKAEAAQQARNHDAGLAQRPAPDRAVMRDGKRLCPAFQSGQCPGERVCGFAHLCACVTVEGHAIFRMRVCGGPEQTPVPQTQRPGDRGVAAFDAPPYPPPPRVGTTGEFRWQVVPV